MTKNKKPHFSDRIDTIILPLEFAYKFKRNSTSPFIIQVYFDCPTIKTMACVVCTAHQGPLALEWIAPSTSVKPTIR